MPARPPEGPDAPETPETPEALDPGAAIGYPGSGLGRPESGPGSIARPGARLLGLVVDWALSLLIARGLLQLSADHPVTSLYPVVVLVLANLLLVPTAGATVGQRVAGIQVERVDGGRLGFRAGATRALLLGLFVPAITLIWQRDQRGAHDLAAGSIVVRSR